jgi:O-antigen ligase
MICAQPRTCRFYRRTAWGVHILLIALALLWLFRAVHADPAIPAWATIIWIISFLLLALAPLQPALGLVIYATLATVVARYEPGVDIPLNTTVLAWIATLAVTATVAWFLSGALASGATGGLPTSVLSDLRVRLFHPHPLTWLLLSLLACITVSCLAAYLRDGRFDPAPEHHPRNYLQALVLYLLATQFLSGAVASLAATICLCLIIRSRLLSPMGIWRQEDIASWIAMAVPLAILCLRPPAEFFPAVTTTCARIHHRLRLPPRLLSRLWSPFFAAILLLLLWELGATQNRTGAMGLAAGLFVLWLLTPRRIIWLLGALPLIALAAWRLSSSAYWHRFTDIWTGGRDQASATSRLELWHYARSFFLQHPLTGIGPGNFEHYFALARPDIDPKPPHNNIVAMLCETGLPGAILYGAFFSGRRHRGPPHAAPGPAPLARARGARPGGDACSLPDHRHDHHPPEPAHGLPVRRLGRRSKPPPNRPPSPWCSPSPRILNFEA